MEWIVVLLLAAVGVALGATLIWVSWRYDQPAGYWWSATAALIAGAQFVKLLHAPAILIPYAADAIAPGSAWLAYRASVAHAGTTPSPFAALAAAAGTLGWLTLHQAGAPDAITFGLAAGVGVALIALSIRHMLGHEPSVAAGLFSAACVVGLVLLAGSRQLTTGVMTIETEARIWLGLVAALALLSICALFERHQSAAHQTLKQREEQLRLGAMIAGLGTWTLERGTGQVEWSPEMFRIYDLPPDAPVPNAAAQLELLAEEDRAGAIEAFARAWADPAELDTEFRIPLGNGEFRHVVTHARRMEVPGRGSRLVGTTVDVTAYRSAVEELDRYRGHLEKLVEQRTEELAASRQQLAQSERLASLGTLSAGLAHQVNNPIGSILAAAGYASLVRGDQDEIDVVRNAISDIEAEARRCGDIVRNMLRFASDQPTDKKVIPIDPLIERTCASARHPTRAPGTHLVFETEGLGEGPLVEASSLELELALGNLIENATLSREDGAVVSVRRFVEGGSVHIEVRDDGDGVPPEALGRILEPFFTTRLAAGGTGLGLSVAHGIARDHGGALSIESLPGRGTAVTLSVPLATSP